MDEIVEGVESDSHSDAYVNIEAGIEDDAGIEEFENTINHNRVNDAITKEDADIEDFEAVLDSSEDSLPLIEKIQERRMEIEENLDLMTRDSCESVVENAAFVHPHFGPENPEMVNKLTDYSSHTEKHLAEVMEKGERLQLAVNAMAEKRSDISGYAPVREDTMQLALEKHDIGMAGRGNQIELFKDSQNLERDTMALRNEHSYRSAVMMLSEAESIREQRGSDTEVEKAALIACFHSKSAYGNNIADLDQLRESIIGFEKRYNEEQGANGKPVDISAIYNNEYELKQIATGISMARLDDSYRDGCDLTTINGEEINIEYENFKQNPNPADIQDELADLKVTYISGDKTRECMDDISKYFAVGEKNIMRNDIYEHNGQLVHVFDITNADKFKNTINGVLRGRIQEIDSGIFSEKDRREGTKPLNKIKINLINCDEKSASAFLEEFARQNPNYVDLVDRGDR